MFAAWLHLFVLFVLFTLFTLFALASAFLGAVSDVDRRNEDCQLAFNSVESSSRSPSHLDERERMQAAAGDLRAAGSGSRETCGQSKLLKRGLTDIPPRGIFTKMKPSNANGA